MKEARPLVFWPKTLLGSASHSEGKAEPSPVIAEPQLKLGLNRDMERNQGLRKLFAVRMPQDRKELFSYCSNYE